MSNRQDCFHAYETPIETHHTAFSSFRGPSDIGTCLCSCKGCSSKGLIALTSKRMASSASTDPFYLVKDDIQASVSKNAMVLGGYRLLPVLVLPSVSIVSML